MEHPELSTTMGISGRRPLRSRDGTETRRRKVQVLEGGYTADTRHRDKMRKKELQHMFCMHVTWHGAQLMHALQVRGFDANCKLMVLTFGLWRDCVSTGCRRPASTGGQYDI